MFPKKEIVERIRKEYPKGVRVRLVRMDDIQAPPIGTEGTVIGVDDTASIMVAWDNGSSLNVIYNEDKCIKISQKCPKCGIEYQGYPAISRKDNKTPICPDCGTREALETIGFDKKEQEQIIKEVHRTQEK